MSFQAMTWAVEQRLPARDKIVLMMLANRTNHETGLCFPSMRRLADECGLSETTTKEAIKALVASGLVEVAHRLDADGNNLTNHYRMAMPGVGRDSTQGGSAADPKPGSRTKKKKEECVRVRVREALDEAGNVSGLEVDASMVEELKAAFPAVDVQLEICRAGLWIASNPANRKSNYPRFLTNWMSRAQAARQSPKNAAPQSRRQLGDQMAGWLFGGNQHGDANVIDVVATRAGN